MECGHRFLLQAWLKVDEQIAATDEIHAGEGRIADEILPREDDHIAKRLDHTVARFLLDEEAAQRSPYGGLIASGWHTAALCMRLIVGLLGPGSGSLGSPGVDEMRWLNPVRPGDELSVHVEVLEAIPRAASRTAGSSSCATPRATRAART